MTASQLPTIVIGDGWSALAATALLAESGRKVRWLTGTGARLIAPLPTLEAGPGIEVWQKIARSLDVECGEPKSGSFLREFRSKSFREATWVKAPTPEMRREVRDEVLWAPEQKIAPAFEMRFSIPLSELEEMIRSKLVNNISRIEGIPIDSFRIKEGKVTGVIMGSGEVIECEEVIYADRWSNLPKVGGLPKPISFLRKREPVGVLQATFFHARPMGVGLEEGFYGALHKEAGEEFERNVWGYFSSDGTRSTWTLCLAQDEVEDNHEIAKRLRRMKSALDKMFSGSAWLAPNMKDFMSNVSNEQVRFEEAMIFAIGDAPTAPTKLPKLDGIVFLTDGYGPSVAMQQAGLLLEVGASNPKAEDMDLTQAATTE